MMRLKEEISKKRPHIKKEIGLFLQNVAPCHRSLNIKNTLITLLTVHRPQNTARMRKILIAEKDAYTAALEN